MGIIYLLTKNLLLDIIVTVTIGEGFLFYEMFTSNDITYLIPILGVPFVIFFMYAWMIKMRNDFEDK